VTAGKRTRALKASVTFEQRHSTLTHCNCRNRLRLFFRRTQATGRSALRRLTLVSRVDWPRWRLPVRAGRYRGTLDCRRSTVAVPINHIWSIINAAANYHRSPARHAAPGPWQVGPLRLELSKGTTHTVWASVLVPGKATDWNLYGIW